MKKIFKSLFRNDGTDSISTETSPPPTDTITSAPASKAEYYVNLLNESQQEALCEKKDFLEVLEKAPAEKILVFFNVQFLEVMSEEDFVKLDEYIHSTEAALEGATFYRAMWHGPCVVHAFSAKLIPKYFGAGKLFFHCPTLVLYF